MLKNKILLNYRKAIDKAESCATCVDFVSAAPIYRIGGELKGHEPRCKRLGLDNSIRYRVRPDHTCTKWACQEVQ